MAAPGNRTWLLNLGLRFTQPQARQYCQQAGGELLSIASAADKQALSDILIQDPLWYQAQSLWAGLISPAGSNHHDVKTNKTATYTPWGTSDPDPAGTTATSDPACLVLQAMFPTAPWSSYPCTKASIGAACQLGEQQIGQGGYNCGSVQPLHY